MWDAPSLFTVNPKMLVFCHQMLILAIRYRRKFPKSVISLGFMVGTGHCRVYEIAIFLKVRPFILLHQPQNTLPRLFLEENHKNLQYSGFSVYGLSTAGSTIAILCFTIDTEGSGIVIGQIRHSRHAVEAIDMKKRNKGGKQVLILLPISRSVFNQIS